MYGARIAGLCLDTISGSMRFSQHYIQQLMSRPTPNQRHIQFLLCEDNPQVIEDYPRDPRGSCCLIWGATDNNGRIGHVVCANPPDSQVITAYFPAETDPNKWEDNYRRRTKGGPA
jgi:hypothetical protein